MKKEISFIVILLALLLLVPGVIAPAIDVAITGDGSNTGGKIESVVPTDAGFESITNCNIDNNGIVIEEDDCKRANHCSSSSILWAKLTLKAVPKQQQPNIEINWSDKSNENYNEQTVKLFDNCESNDRSECTIELRCPQDIGGGIYNPAKRLSYTINAKFEKINIPPTVSITSPINGATFIESETITITAEAKDPDPDGSIKNVEFYDGPTRIGVGTRVGTTDQYTYNWLNVPAKSYSLTAKATDNKDAITISDPPVRITVKAGICGDGVIQSPNSDGLSEECDGVDSLCPSEESCYPPGSKNQCTCTQDYCTGACEVLKYEPQGECVNGQQLYKFKVKNDAGCDKLECKETKAIPCGRLVTSLPFFGTLQFISSIVLILIIYMFAAKKFGRK